MRDESREMRDERRETRDERREMRAEGKIRTRLSAGPRYAQNIVKDLSQHPFILLFS
jgi:hypothetical protein